MTVEAEGGADEARARAIAEAIAAYEREGAPALARACESHPELADEIRRTAATLDLLHQASPIDHTLAAAAIGPGSVVGRFRILEVVGQGGMGRVFRAEDLDVGRQVALKIIAVPFASRADALARLRREARLLAQAAHDNIVRVLAVGETGDGLPFLVMDLVDGVPLSDLLARLAARPGAAPERFAGGDLLAEVFAGGAPPRAAASYAEAVVRLLLPIADALEQAHRVGVIHRDVKPSNILIDRDGRPHLVDFGIAREIDAATLSVSRTTSGTPSYMAPEQVADPTKRGDLPATDVYALGVTLYQALTLRVPFEGESPIQVCWNVMHTPPRRPREWNPAISADLETICLAAMEKETRDRYASAREFAADLRALLELRPISRRPLGPFGRAVRLVRRNRWPATAALALMLTVLSWIFAGFAVHRGRADAQRVRDLTREAYAAIAERPARLDAVHSIVAELARLAPKQGEVLDLVEAVRRLDKQEKAGADDLEARDALAELEATVASSGPEAAAKVDTLVRQAQSAINRVIVLQPGSGTVAGLFARADAALAAWTRRSSAGLAALVADAAGAKGADATGLALDGGPVGADVHLFRYELLSELERGGEERLVPVAVAPVDGKEAGASAAVARVDARVEPGRDALIVERVAPGSAAERAGVRAGDFIVELDGRPVDGRVLVAVGRGGEAAGPRLAQVTRLNGRAIHEEFDVEAIRITSAPGDEFRAEVIVEPASDPFATPRTIVVRRTAAGFEPPLASACGALRARLPPEGVDLVAVSGAERRSLHLAGGAPSGLTLLATANPLPCVAGNRLGALPLATHALPPGSYLAVVRREGFETLRVPFELRAGRATVLRVDLQAEGTSPPGFVEVAAGPWIAGTDPAGRVLGWPRQERWLDRFWIGRTEVTVADYLAFVNDREDPRTVEEIAEGERTRTFTRIPRDVVIDRTARATCRPLWERRDAGYVTDWDPELPVRFVSCEDADAYCRWLTCFSPLGQAGWWFRLPTEEEWEKTARGADGRAYPWGNRFDERMRRSDRAHDLSGLDSTQYDRIVFEPVTRATRDESPYGVLDLAGNVLEWCIGESYEEIPFRRPWRGGCARGPEASQIPSTQRGGGYPDRVSQNDGFRVVAWRPDAR